MITKNQVTQKLSNNSNKLEQVSVKKEAKLT